MLDPEDVGPTRHRHQPKHGSHDDGPEPRCVAAAVTRIRLPDRRRRRGHSTARGLGKGPHQVHRGEEFQLPQHPRGLELDGDGDACRDKRQRRHEHGEQRHRANDHRTLRRGDQPTSRPDDVHDEDHDRRQGVREPCAGAPVGVREEVVLGGQRRQPRRVHDAQGVGQRACPQHPHRYRHRHARCREGGPSSARSHQRGAAEPDREPERGRGMDQESTRHEQHRESGARVQDGGDRRRSPAQT